MIKADKRIDSNTRPEKEGTNCQLPFVPLHTTTPDRELGKQHNAWESATASCIAKSDMQILGFLNTYMIFSLLIQRPPRPFISENEKDHVTQIWILRRRCQSCINQMLRSVSSTKKKKNKFRYTGIIPCVRSSGCGNQCNAQGSKNTSPEAKKDRELEKGPGVKNKKATVPVGETCTSSLFSPLPPFPSTCILPAN